MTITKYKLNSAQYHLMAETGIFNHVKGDRVELIAGEITEMSPIGSKHCACVARLQKMFERALGENVIVWTQCSIKLSELSEPQPDLTLLRLKNNFYAEQLPNPSDILLIIEVADSTISYDRDVKIPIYAKFDIPEAWLVDVNRETLTRYTNPSPTGYKSTQIFDKNDFVTCMGTEIAIAIFLGE